MIYNKDIDIIGMKAPPKYEIVDSHLHFLDFTQDSDGFPSLVKVMDNCGVSEAVVFGMPMTKKWDYLMKEKPTYYMSNDSRCYYYSATDHILAHELLSQTEEIQKRFHPFCCGFDCTDKYAATQIEMEELLIIAGHLLHDNPNLYVDISWIFFENYVTEKNSYCNCLQ